MTTYHVEVNVTVEVEVNDPNVIDRCVNNEPMTRGDGTEVGWRDQMYPLYDRDDVLGHLAYNAAVNDVWEVSRLDGWADLPEEAATMRVIDTETGFVYEHPQAAPR